MVIGDVDSTLLQNHSGRGYTDLLPFEIGKLVQQRGGASASFAPYLIRSWYQVSNCRNRKCPSGLFLGYFILPNGWERVSLHFHFGGEWQKFHVIGLMCFLIKWNNVSKQSASLEWCAINTSKRGKELINYCAVTMMSANDKIRVKY